MDVLRKLRGWESRLAKTVDEAAQKITQGGTREPLEVVHAIVDAAEERIEPAGRGKYVFPFNRISVGIVASSRESRARFEAVLGSEPPLRARIVERLEAAGCDLTGLSVYVGYVEHAEPHWTRPEFNVEFYRFAGPQQSRPQPGAANPHLKLTILHGVAETPEYIFKMPQINLGRCPEVRDSRNRLIRTNHVAFAEDSGL